MRTLRPLRLAGFALLLTGSLQAGSREAAFRARELLGPDVWSRVVRIENERAGPGSRYPAEFHALVIAFEGILWLYTESDGTQNLSLYRGRLAEDQANLGPLFQAVEPGLARFTDVTDQRPAGRMDPLLPNGCFVTCVVRWQELQRGAEPPTRARLIASYPRAQRTGHMMLEFWHGARRHVFDPDQPAVPHALPRRLADDPLAVARSVLQQRNAVRPVRATHLDLSVPARPEPQIMIANSRAATQTRV